ncbi:EF-hand calcium-binding domain-containing protein 6 isoform X2 [Lingula anatina]|uniref:EF-hand calcium-binding domain-containing protein 6 isoform X2 n=1 Tax=Lingula anatina TaxID=7574 RepID=A0A1S3K2H5_LINAN|nr:EF-hand calcium-binding domain-containing protein 6 isoform X2 [Lingula anatina]|eukprot:XP_013416722.1 EF-hand calcium-binding domain-containing protein 6 isoform X2 [Lingula anatina]
MALETQSRPAMGPRRSTLPVISHPASRLDNNELTVRGSSRQSPRHPHALSRHATLPSMPLRTTEKPRKHHRVMSWPPGGESKVEESEDSFQQNNKDGSEEVKDLINEKLKTGFHALRHLFKSNDPTGQGVVSREALYRILLILCGHLQQEQFPKVLKRLGLGHKKSISFDDFISCFKDNETVQREWLAPAHQKEIITLGPRGHTSVNLLSTSIHQNNEFSTAAHCMMILREKAKMGKLNLSRILPPACFESRGIIVPPQLREAMAALGMRFFDDEFKKLWDRLNLEGTGGIKLSNFKKVIGVDDGPKMRQGASDPKEEVLDQQAYEKDRARRKETAERKIKTVVNKRRETPKLESVVDCLHYQFEQNYTSLLLGCRLFDFLGDGHIARIDLKKVLHAFGFPISSIELESFLARCHVRTMQGQLNYNELLLKYMNKSNQSLLSRVVNDSFHVFSRSALPPLTEDMTAEDLEARLVEFLHKDFLALIGSLRGADRYELGVIPQYEFRDAIQKVLKRTLSDGEWQKLIAEVGQDADGLIPYNTFLEQFACSTPGGWNQKTVGGFLERKVSDMRTPPEVQQLREAKEREEVADIKKGSTRKEELNKKIKQLLKEKFHAVDKLYKKMDRRQTGRLSKEQMGAILKEFLGFGPEEVDLVWKDIPLFEDHLTTWSKFMAQFVKVNGLVKSPEKSESRTPLPPVSKASQLTPAEAERKQKERDNKLDTLLPRENAATELHSGGKEGLMNKIKSDVLTNWEHLKFIFKNLDTVGTAYVPCTEMKECMNTLGFNLTAEELKELCQEYDVNKDGQFHYLKFLQAFAVKSPKPQTPKKQTVPSAYKNRMYKLRQKLLLDWKSLRRAFKKNDLNNSGYLEVIEFRRVLESCGLNVSEEDIYHIMSEFDKNLDGKISYEEFLNSLLEP